MSYSGYDSGYSRETKGSNEERYSKLNRDTNQRSTFEESNDFNRNEDCKIDSEKTEKFVVKISHFPFEINEAEINNCINIHCAKHLCVYPTSIRFVNDCKTGKPIFGYIEFNTQYEYNEVLQKGIFILSKKIRAEPIAPRNDKPSLNIDYIKKLQKELRKKDEIVKKWIQLSCNFSVIF